MYKIISIVLVFISLFVLDYKQKPFFFHNQLDSFKLADKDSTIEGYRTEYRILISSCEELDKKLKTFKSQNQFTSNTEEKGTLIKVIQSDYDKLKKLLSNYNKLLFDDNNGRSIKIEDIAQKKEEIINLKKTIDSNLSEFKNDSSVISTPNSNKPSIFQENKNENTIQNTSENQPSFAEEEIIEKKVKNGYYPFTYKDADYTAFVVDLKEKDKVLSFFLTDKQNRFYNNINNLKNELKKEGKILLFATNGGMYRQGGYPQGLFVANGIEMTEVDLKQEVKGEFLNFYIQPNGIFYINDKNLPTVCTTDEYIKANNNLKVSFATQSGPMLIYNSVINKNFNKDSKNVNIRNGVGLLSDGRIIFLISNEPVTFYNFSLAFKKFGCKNALYLDGAISKMYVQNNREDNDLYGNLGPLIGLFIKK